MGEIAKITGLKDPYTVFFDAKKLNIGPIFMIRA